MFGDCSSHNIRQKKKHYKNNELEDKFKKGMSINTYKILGKQPTERVKTTDDFLLDKRF